jgi:hypothetical protein
MTLDVRARATAQKLMAKFGKTCVLKSVAGTFDPVTGLPDSTSYIVKLYLDSPNRSDLDGGQVISTDSMAIFAAKGLPVEPKVNDYIAVDTKDRQVKSVSATWSGELVALWRVGLQS